jgi:mRNA interferase MazF
MNRGDVVTVDFSLYDPADKVRPALVVQNDRDNTRMTKTIVALITTNIRRAGEDTQYLIERSHPDFPGSGLFRDSAVNCSNLYTIRQSDISHVIGRLSAATMERIDACLKVALELH